MYGLILLYNLKHIIYLNYCEANLIIIQNICINLYNFMFLFLKNVCNLSVFWFFYVTYFVINCYQIVIFQLFRLWTGV